MSFTDEERTAWKAEKRRRETRPEPAWKPTPVAICLHCSNPFEEGKGVVTDDAALCDVCNGD